MLASTAAFYTGEWKRETEELGAIGVKPPRATPRTEEHLIRLRRHSGAECLTIAGHRNIRIMQGKGQQPKFSSQSTTLWLAAESDKPRDDSGLRSFGWAALRDASEEEIFQLEDARARQASALSEIKETREAQCHGSGPEDDLPQVVAEQSEPCREVKLEIWDQAVISWRPNDQTVIASFGNRKAQAKGRDHIPEALAEKVLGKKKKPVRAKVHVESMARDSYRIIKIETQP